MRVLMSPEPNSPEPRMTYLFLLHRTISNNLTPAECVPTYQGRVYKCRKWICANIYELESAPSQSGQSVSRFWSSRS